MTVHLGELPPGALLQKYRDGEAYTDCYYADIARPVSQAAYTEAFYTTPVFRLERMILAWAVSRPSTDEQAAALANGSADAFAAWSVEGRTDDQLLLCDLHGRTRSWLMSVPLDGGTGTRLYFGSAVVPVSGRDGRASLGTSYRALLGFHRFYSRVLLQSAHARLARSVAMR